MTKHVHLMLFWWLSVVSRACVVDRLFVGRTVVQTFYFFRGFLLWFQMALEYTWHVLKGNYAELEHSQDSKCFSEDFCCDFKWLWNKPDASHQIGVVETLIKSVRKGLHASCKLKNRTFTEEQWRTFLSETTFIINGRPLYLSSNNIWESPPITPNDILMGHHLPLPHSESEERVNPRLLLRSTHDRVNEFWKCWMRYFAPNQLPLNKWLRTKENVEVDDLVLELDPNQKRSRWKLARVVTTYRGNDGLVRKARIKTQGGEYDRPIHKLCLIATKEELNT